jgi:hypothetical protein
MFFKIIHGIIDDIPGRNLFILRPLLDLLADKNTADDSLSSEELRLLEQCRKDRKERPENLASWQKVRRETAAAVIKER